MVKVYFAVMRITNLNSESDRNYSVDYLRAIAIVLVLSVHVSIYSDLAVSTETSKFLVNLSGYGIYGVELFFVISGFLIDLLYGGENKFCSKTYFLKRFLRVYPLWAIFLALQVVLLISLNLGGVALAHSISHNSVFQNYYLIIIIGLTTLLWISPLLWNTVIPGGWSIQSEIFHYLIYPIYRSRRTLSLSLCATANFLIYFFTDESKSSLSWLSFSSVMHYLFRELCIFGTLSFFLLGANLSNIFSKRIFNNSRRLILVYGLFVASLFFSKIPFGKTSEAIVILFCCYVFTQILVRVNSHIKLLQMIAKYSYFTYYCHFYILILLEKIYSKYIALNNTILKSYEFTFLTFFMITLAICLALGKLSYRYFEVKLISLGQKTVNK